MASATMAYANLTYEERRVDAETSAKDQILRRRPVLWWWFQVLQLTAWLFSSQTLPDHVTPAVPGQ